MGRRERLAAPASDQMSATTALERLAFEARHNPHNAQGPRRTPQPPRMHFCAAHVASPLQRRLLEAPGAIAPVPLSGRPLCLWACGLSLTHPCTGELVRLEVPEPACFEEVRAAELATWQEHHGTPGQSEIAPWVTMVASADSRRQSTW